MNVADLTTTISEGQPMVEVWIKEWTRQKNAAHQMHEQACQPLPNWHNQLQCADRCITEGKYVWACPEFKIFHPH